MGEKEIVKNIQKYCHRTELKVMKYMMIIRED